MLVYVATNVVGLCYYKTEGCELNNNNNTCTCIYLYTYIHTCKEKYTMKSETTWINTCTINNTFGTLSLQTNSKHNKHLYKIHGWKCLRCILRY